MIRLKRLIAKLDCANNNKNPYDFSIEHDIMTLDDIKIPTNCFVSKPNFSCFTKENFEYYDIFFGEFTIDYS